LVDASRKVIKKDLSPGERSPFAKVASDLLAPEDPFLERQPFPLFHNMVGEEALIGKHGPPNAVKTRVLHGRTLIAFAFKLPD
jgi:hypothetical protein